MEKVGEEENVKVGLSRCTLLMEVEYKSDWRKLDCCWVELNLATLPCWGHYQILNIGVSLTAENTHEDIFLNAKLAEKLT